MFLKEMPIMLGKEISMHQLCGVLVLAVISLQACAGTNLPLDLSQVAKEHGCEEILNFMDRPGMVEPSYAYGYLPGEKENSAVFWCQSTTDNYTYKLIVHSNDGKAFGCPGTITSNNYPGGLSISSSVQLSLTEFRYLKNNKPGPEATTSGKYIKSYYDGVEHIYYCHQGDWLILFRH